GKKADINVIDHSALRLHRPPVLNHLPGGGRPMIRGADAYLSTFVSGQIDHRAAVATGGRRGRLVRQPPEGPAPEHQPSPMEPRELSMSDLYQALLQDPLNFHDACYDDGFRLTADQLHDVQLAGIRKRFGELRPKLSVLDKLASEQGVDNINAIDDIAPLMFPHTIYKSYPMSYLERARFDKLTRWLGGLTTVDLDQVDASGIDSIDGWLDLLDAQTDLLVSHSSGTTGKLSFVPRTKAQWRQ